MIWRGLAKQGTEMDSYYKRRSLSCAACKGLFVSVLVSVHCTKLCLYVYRPISVWTSLDGQISPLLKPTASIKKFACSVPKRGDCLCLLSLVFVCVSLSLYLCLCRCICVLLEPLKRSCHARLPRPLLHALYQREETVRR